MSVYHITLKSIYFFNIYCIFPLQYHFQETLKLCLEYLSMQLSHFLNKAKRTKENSSVRIELEGCDK